MYNIYCDESCHLENDGMKHMVLGAVTCEKSSVKRINKELRELKMSYGLDTKFELKWTKVGAAKLDYYKKIIDFFMDNNSLSFRAILANKEQLRHQDFHQTHDEWYYKMYYYLLRQLITPETKYKIYIDIKDTHGGAKVRKLHDVLNHTLYQFCDETILGIQQINSKESEIIQMCDILIGALSYHSRGLYSSRAKSDLVEYLKYKTALSLKESTPPYCNKFNLFVWKPR